MKHKITHLTPLSCLLLSACTVGGGAPNLSVPKSESINPSEISAEVLFVGNSFTYYNDLPDIFAQLGQGLGMQLNSYSVTKGSQKLIDTANSNDELGKVFDEAMNKKYTHIILQEHSTLPVNNYTSFVNGVKAIKQKIQNAKQEAHIYLYSTWAYESMCNQNESIPDCEKRIRAAYEQCASETGLDVIYVGKAFSYTYEHNKSIDLYDANDRKHPSYAGSYLSAATHLASIFNVNVKESTFKGNLADNVSNTLKEVAYGVANRLI